MSFKEVLGVVVYNIKNIKNDSAELGILYVVSGPEIEDK